MKKCVLELDLQNDKDQQRRAFKTVSTLPGIDEIAIDLKGKKLVVIGTVDPVSVVSKLRKRNWPAHIISVGVWPEKKDEPKKEAPKKEEEPKKDEAKKEEEPKKEGEANKKEEPKKEEASKKVEDQPKKEVAVEKKVEPEMVMGTAAALAYRPPMQMQQYRQYYPPPPPMNSYYHVHHSIEENPNACVIC